MTGCKQRQTCGSQITGQSLIFISREREDSITEDQSHRRNSIRGKKTGESPTFNGCPTTRIRRRYLSTCLFSLDRLNRLGESCCYGNSSHRAGSSGPENGSAHQCGSMIHYHLNSNTNARRRTNRPLTTARHSQQAANGSATDRGERL